MWHAVHLAQVHWNELDHTLEGIESIAEKGKELWRYCPTLQRVITAGTPPRAETPTTLQKGRGLITTYNIPRGPYLQDSQGLLYLVRPMPKRE